MCKQISKSILVLGLSMALVACGGGGDDVETNIENLAGVWSSPEPYAEATSALPDAPEFFVSISPTGIARIVQLLPETWSANTVEADGRTQVNFRRFYLGQFNAEVLANSGRLVGRLGYEYSPPLCIQNFEDCNEVPTTGMVRFEGQAFSDGVIQGVLIFDDGSEAVVDVEKNGDQQSEDDFALASGLWEGAARAGPSGIAGVSSATRDVSLEILEDGTGFGAWGNDCAISLALDTLALVEDDDKTTANYWAELVISGCDEAKTLVGTAVAQSYVEDPGAFAYPDLLFMQLVGPGRLWTFSASRESP